MKMPMTMMARMAPTRRLAPMMRAAMLVARLSLSGPVSMASRTEPARYRFRWPDPFFWAVALLYVVDQVLVLTGRA